VTINTSFIPAQLKREAVACESDLSALFSDRLEQQKHDVAGRLKKNQQQEPENGMALPNVPELMATLVVAHAGIQRETRGEEPAAVHRCANAATEDQGSTSSQPSPEPGMISRLSHRDKPVLPFSIAARTASVAVSAAFEASDTGQESPVASLVDSDVIHRKIVQRVFEPAQLNVQPPVHAESPYSQRTGDAPATVTQPATRLSPLVDDAMPTIAHKTIRIDHYDGGAEMYYPVADKACAKVTLAERKIVPVSENLRLNELLVGQSLLLSRDRVWHLQDAQSARPYYLSSADSATGKEHEE